MVKPEIVFKVGAVRASVFRNIVEKNGKSISLPKVALEVRYKDKIGRWQGTNWRKAPKRGPGGAHRRGVKSA